MKAGIKKQVVLNLPLLVFVYVGNKISWLYRMIDTVDISKKVYGCLIYFSKAFKDPFPSFHATDIAIGMLCAAAVKLVLYWKSKNTKKYPRANPSTPPVIASKCLSAGNLNT